MKVKFRFWRELRIHQECEVELELPDYLAVDQYAPSSAASAYFRRNNDNMPWNNKGATIEKSGHGQIFEEVKEDGSQVGDI